MSSKLYINILIAIIVILVLGGVYAYFYKGFNKISKTLIIWYLIILILNLLNIIGVMKFYMNNQGRKGPKGRKGDKGPRGFKGSNNICSSCNDAGSQTKVYGSFINDNGEKVLSKKVKEGECIFPFSYNYQYKFQCVKDKPPPGLTENDASMFGWCATKIDSQREPVTYAYCNANSSINEKRLKEEELRKKRKDFMENNFGILDIDVIAENTTNQARKKCEAKDGFEFYERDLNEGTDGKFVHLCMKKGYGGTGIAGIKITEHGEAKTPVPTIEEDGKIYKLINVDLNKDSGGSKTKAAMQTRQLYMYKYFSNKNYIKDIQVVKATEGTCNDDIGYDEIFPDLNKGTHLEGSDPLRLCVSSESSNVMSIDTAFVYKDKSLYILRGFSFYKMTTKPVQNAIMSENNYPKNLSLKWGQVSNSKKPAKDCRTLNKKECNSAPNCTYDSKSDPVRCEEISNYDAAFTYAYNNRTYFFKGSKVYMYDDKKMKMTDDSPFNINDIFKGIPNNINAVFTWAKDNSTYFFKGPFYYKYNDKTKSVESGYPKRSNVRWENMPPLIDAIFSLPFNMEDNFGNQSTFVISGDQTWYINPSNDKLVSQKGISERFIGLDVLKEEKEKDEEIDVFID